MNKTDLVSIVILAGPGKEEKKSDLLRGIKSIYRSRHRNFEILIIDNSESRYSLDFLQQEFSGIKIIKMPQNNGISGYNVGIVNSKGNFILFFDDDCTIESEAITNALTQFNTDTDKKIGAICANLYNPIKKYYYYSEYLKKASYKLVSFAGGATIFRKEIFSKTGLYDPDFFCWMHEDDLAIRLLNSGYYIVLNPNVVINHHDNKISARNYMYFLSYRNKAWFNLKNFRIIYLPMLFIRDLIWIFLLIIRKKRPSPTFLGLAGYLWGYLSFIRYYYKRHVVSDEIQKQYLKSFLFSVPRR